MRRISLLLAVLLVAGLALPAMAAKSGGTLDDCIHMWIPDDILVNPGQLVRVPVYISNTTGWGIVALEAEICWCDTPAGLLQYKDCDGGPVAKNSGWEMAFCNPCQDNCVSVAAADESPLQGEGILFYLIFHVSNNAKPCMCCTLRLDVTLYDPEKPLEVCEEDGEVCVEACNIYGLVRAWFCKVGDCDEVRYPEPIPGARVHLHRCEEPIASTITGPCGAFKFECLEPLHTDGDLISFDCEYCIELDDCAPLPGTINAFDAALILQHLVCIDPLECCPIPRCPQGAGLPTGIYPQQVAADVNCTGVITAYDASLILQYSVGIIDAFPCPQIWYWYFLNCRGNCTDVCPDQMYKFFILGVAKGDVSGECYKQGGDLIAAAPEASVGLGVPWHYNGYVEVPLEVKNAQGVFSAEFEVVYDENELEVIDVSAGSLTSGFMMAHFAENGVLNVAMAGSQAFSGNGQVAMITYEKKHSTVPMASKHMSLVDAMLNEDTPSIEGNDYSAEIVRFGLGPASPNPFTDAVVIHYSAPKSADVSIDIYDVSGRLVRRVQSGQVAAGSHQATWDCRDNAGAKVARGVYFCRMTAGQFSATEKLVMLQ